MSICFNKMLNVEVGSKLGANRCSRCYHRFEKKRTVFSAEKIYSKQCLQIQHSRHSFAFYIACGLYFPLLCLPVAVCRYITQTPVRTQLTRFFLLCLRFRLTSLSFRFKLEKKPTHKSKNRKWKSKCRIWKNEVEKYKIA